MGVQLLFRKAWLLIASVIKEVNLVDVVTSDHSSPMDFLKFSISLKRLESSLYFETLFASRKSLLRRTLFRLFSLSCPFSIAAAICSEVPELHDFLSSFSKASKSSSGLSENSISV